MKPTPYAMDYIELGQRVQQDTQHENGGTPEYRAGVIAWRAASATGQVPQQGRVR